MLNCVTKIRWGKVFTAGFIYLLIATAIRQIEAVLTMDYYMMPQYFGVWSKLMMPAAGPPPASFFFWSVVFSLIAGLALAALYDFIKGSLPEKYWQRVRGFSEIIIGLMLALSYLPMYLLINVPLMLLASWFVSGSLAVFFGAMVFAKLIR